MKSKTKQRTKEVKVRLTEGELARLNDNVALTGLSREQLDYTLQLLNSTVLLMQGAMLPRTFSPFTPNGEEVNPYGGFAD